jgi:hypothetical protein
VLRVGAGAVLQGLQDVHILPEAEAG